MTLDAPRQPVPREPGLIVELVRDPRLLADKDGPLSRIRWPNFDAEPDVVLAIAESRETVFRPCSVVIRRGEKIAGAAMMRVDRTELPVQLGYRLAYRPRMEALVAQHGGVAGVDDASVAEQMVDTIRDLLADGVADVALLPSLRVGSHLVDRLAREPWALRAHFEDRQIHRSTTIPRSAAEFLAARSQNTRRNAKRVRTAFEERVSDPRVRRYSTADELPAAIQELERVAERTWQRKVGGGFSANPTELALYRAAVARDAFRAWILSDADRPIAFLVGLVHDGVFKGRYMAFDPDYEQYRPGFYLFTRLVEDLCSDDRIDCYDFGVGDSQFKRSFADTVWFECDCVLFAPRARPIRINATRSAAGAVRAGGKGLLSRFEALGNARRRWRRTITRQ